MGDDKDIGRRGALVEDDDTPSREAGDLVATLSLTAAPTVGDMPKASGLAEGSDGPRVGGIATAPTLAAGSQSTGEPGGSDERADVTSPGKRIGRLELGATLGSGAFGVVVEAYDPELKRKLAVKLLRPEVFGSASGKDAQKRLLREARAMARIAHPNVVTVHDIGTVGGQVFVAMEYIDGWHLRAWIALAPRSWQELVQKFAMAGRGLAAAHGAGLVHRDFKPDNVLVGQAGEVRVADFGLVGIAAKREPEAAAPTKTQVPRVNSEELGLTRAGAVMGTALYMAPEQHRGHEAGPAADQFAFCAALYWALYKRAPFEGRSYEELRENVLRGRLLIPSADGKVPKWLWPIVRRGLSTDPAARYESMDALLAELDFDPKARRNTRITYAALGLATVAAIGGVTLSMSGAKPVCEGAEQRLTGIWDAAAKERLGQLYLGANRGTSYERLVSTVDAFSTEWTTARTKVCEATHVVGDQSDAQLDVRMSCLDEHLGDLSALLGRLDRQSDATVLDRAVRAALALSSPDSCVLTSSERTALPHDPEERAEVLKLREQVQVADAHVKLGDAASALPVLEKVVESTVVFPPLQAKATNLLGKALTDLGRFEESEKALHQSVEHATVAGNDLSVASSWLALMYLEGVERENYQEGLEMGRLARLALTRGKADAFELAGVDRSEAMILLREGKAKEAVELLESVLPVFEDAADEADLAHFLWTLADAKAADARYEDAIADYRLSLAHIESALGPEHLDNVYVLNNLSVSLKNVGQTAEAMSALERSLTIVEATYGPVHRNVVTILNNLGNLARRDGDNAKARAVLERSIAVGNEVLDPGHPNISKAIMNLGIVLAAEGDYEAATGRFLVVLERSRKSFEGDHPDTAMALNNVGEAMALSGDYEEALGYVQDALAMKTRLYGEGHPRCASSIATVGTTLAKMKRYDEAATHLRTAHDIYKEAAGPLHALTIKTKSELGALYLEAGDAKRAVGYLRGATSARGTSTDVAQGKDQLALAKALWIRGERKAAAEEERAVEAVLAAHPEERELSAALKAWRQER